MSDTTKIREVMKRRREELGMTQEEAALACGVGHNSLGAWERGTTDPSLTNFLKWCEGLGLDPACVVASGRPGDAP